MNELLATAPFDLYELALFHLVVKHGSFTRAATQAGRTQSALTRQIQGMEQRLGMDLLERTTRQVRATPAGQYLFRESARLLGDVEQTLRRLQEDFANAPKEIRIGVSRSISPAYLPGFFHANLRQGLPVSYRVTSQSGHDILAAVEAGELDLGVLAAPTRLPKKLMTTHRFTDAFALIASDEVAETFHPLARTKPARRRWLQQQDWLLLEADSHTGKTLRRWMLRIGLKVEPAMQLDSFDLIINLVALGLGVSFVPKRALALYGRKRNLARLPLPNEFSRELLVVVRRQQKQPQHLQEFVRNILFHQ